MKNSGCKRLNFVTYIQRFFFFISMQILQLVISELQRVKKVLFISNAVFSGTFAPIFVYM